MGSRFLIANMMEMVNSVKAGKEATISLSQEIMTHIATGGKITNKNKLK